MSLRALVNRRPGEFIAHWAFQVRLHLFVMILTVVQVILVVMLMMVIVVMTLMIVMIMVTNLTPLILWQTVKTLLGRLLPSTPNLTM